MALNLASVTPQVSQVLGGYLPTHPSRGLSINDAETVVEYLKTLPGVKVELEIVAYSNAGMGSGFVDLKWLKDNCSDRTKPLQLTLQGPITLPQSVPGADRQQTTVKRGIKSNAADVARLLAGVPGVNSVEAFLCEYGFTPAELDSYYLTLPAVRTFIADYLAKF